MPGPVGRPERNAVTTKDQKIIRSKVSLLEQAEQIRNVTQACKLMGYSREAAGSSRSAATRAAGRPR